MIYAHVMRVLHRNETQAPLRARDIASQLPPGFTSSLPVKHGERTLHISIKQIGLADKNRQARLTFHTTLFISRKRAGILNNIRAATI